MNLRSAPMAVVCAAVVCLITCIAVYSCLLDYSFFPLGMDASSVGFSLTAQSFALAVSLALSVMYGAWASQERVVLAGVVSFMISLAIAGMSVSGYVGIPIVQSLVLTVAFVGLIILVAQRQPGPIELVVAVISGVMAGCLGTFLYYSFTQEPMEKLPENAFDARQITQAEWLDWGYETTASWVVSVVRQEEAQLKMTEGAPVHAAVLPLSLAATYEDGVILVNKAMLYVARPDYDDIKKIEWRSRQEGEEPEPYKFQRGVGPNALAAGASHAAALELIVRAQDDASYWTGWAAGPEKMPQGKDYPQSEDPTYAATWNYGVSRYGKYIQSGFVTDSSGTDWEGKY